MPKFSANLTMMYTEVDFLERFGAAAADGFTAVEYMFPYDWPAEQLQDLLQQNNQQQVLFNLPVDEWADGVRGIACIPGREQEFQENVSRALGYAKVLQCPQVNCLAGLTPQGAAPDQVRAHLHVAGRGFDVLVAQQHLDRVQVDTGLQQVRRKGMPQPVKCHRPLEPGRTPHLAEDLRDPGACHGSVGPLIASADPTGKDPCIRRTDDPPVVSQRA